MAEEMNNKRQEILDEIITRKKMGDKKFHSETSLQHFDDDAKTIQNDPEVFVSKDPGVLNTSVGNVSEEIPERRRTMSQPGPLSGNLQTATAARMARRRGNRGVSYLEVSDVTGYDPPQTMSQPGPLSGNMHTATAARMARRRGNRAVVYLDVSGYDLSRIISQPGPLPGNFQTATAARMARRQWDRGVAYLDVSDVTGYDPSRTMSQPGPLSGNMHTATAARMARRRGNRTVVYLDVSDVTGYDPSRTMSQPGPLSGNLQTATAAQMARKRGNLSVANLDVIDVTGFNPSRIISQPGPLSGNLQTATAARMAKKLGNRGVAYPDDSPDKQLPPKLVLSNDNSGTTTPIGDKNFSPLQNGSYRNGDLKSLNSYRLYTPASERGGGTPRKRSVATMDAQSIRSVETHAPPPTHPKENSKQTKKYLSLVASCMYAILLVTVGFMIYLADSFLETDPAVYYSLILCSIGLIYHIYLLIDIGRYKSIALKNQKIKALSEEKIADFYRSQEEEYDINTPEDRPESYRGIALPQLLPLSHDYCFSQGRHSGSFYLKLGAAGFAMGHLVHSILLIAVQISQLIDDDVNNDDCVNIFQVVLDVLSPLYCFLQLFFIFKYSNVIILRAQGVAHFAFMHMIGSSLCFWIAAIVRETILGLRNYSSSRDDSDYYTRNGNATVADPDFAARFIDVDNLYNENCSTSHTLTTIFENFSPYLYPFTVEFNIFIVAVYYIIWSNIGNCHNEEGLNSEINSSFDENYLVCKIPTANEDNDYTSNIVIHADCHASNKGLFVGLILMVAIAGMLILGFVFSGIGEDFFAVGYMLNDATRLCIHVIMLFSVVVAYNQLRKLDINEHPVSLLDDVLLFICLPAFFMETMLSMVATINILNIVKSIDFMVMVIQVLVQTPLIMDGLRRCSNTKKLRRTKPGRELLMFLIIANVGMWLFYTFSFKSPESLDERYTFYGKVLWSILGHVTLPLIMFYRFHSSVCFADIWDSAYKPGSEH